MTSPTAILAGNHSQFKDYLYRDVRELNIKHYKYIDNPSATRGLQFRDIIIIGTFWDRYEAQEIHAYTTACLEV